MAMAHPSNAGLDLADVPVLCICISFAVVFLVSFALVFLDVFVLVFALVFSR